MQVSKALVELPTKPHALYRFYDRTDVLLYVGITMDLPARVGQHRKDKLWWTEVAHITVEQFSTRSAALAAEERAIKGEKPLYNSTHNEMVHDRSEHIRTAVGSKREYADYLLHQQADGHEQYEAWLEEARKEIANASDEDDLDGADDVVYAAELAAVELGGTAHSAQRALSHLLDQLPEDQVDRCRDRALDEDSHYGESTELEIAVRTSWFVAAEFAAGQGISKIIVADYLRQLPEDERNEWIKAARVFIDKPKARWWEVATHAAAYARHRKSGTRYPHADSMCSERGRFSAACPSKAEVKAWFEDCRICRDPEEVDRILEALRAIVDAAEGRDLTDEEAERYEGLEVALGVLRTRECQGHADWCRRHLRQCMDKPFTWAVDDQPIVVARHEVLEPDWDDPWRAAPAA